MRPGTVAGNEPLSSALSASSGHVSEAAVAEILRGVDSRGGNLFGDAGDVSASSQSDGGAVGDVETDVGVAVVGPAVAVQPSSTDDKLGKSSAGGARSGVEGAVVEVTASPGVDNTAHRCVEESGVGSLGVGDVEECGVGSISGGVEESGVGSLGAGGVEESDIGTAPSVPMVENGARVGLESASVTDKPVSGDVGVTEGSASGGDGIGSDSGNADEVAAGDADGGADGGGAGAAAGEPAAADGDSDSDAEEAGVLTLNAPVDVRSLPTDKSLRNSAFVERLQQEKRQREEAAKEEEARQLAMMTEEERVSSVGRGIVALVGALKSVVVFVRSCVRERARVVCGGSLAARVSSV